MNDIMNREESPLATFMAAVGLLVMICLLAWLAVQLVRFIPTMFSRLAVVFDENQRQLDERTGDENVVVVTNDDGEQTPADDTDETPAAVDDKDVSETDTAPETPVVADNKPTPTTSTPKPAPVEYKTVVTYKQPVSDPKGYTDLHVAFVAVGTMTSGDRFVAAPHLEEDERSALQFKVKNIGTKTSAEWRFVAELPDGSTITSLPQKPLLPSETSTLTIAFDGVEGRKDRDLGVSLIIAGDINTADNGFKVKVDVK